jgi:hypothetical protein
MLLLQTNKNSRFVRSKKSKKENNNEPGPAALPLAETPDQEQRRAAR